jgi:hypothetical protein
MMIVPYRKHAYRLPRPVTEITLQYPLLATLPFSGSILLLSARRANYIRILTQWQGDGPVISWGWSRPTGAGKKHVWRRIPLRDPLALTRHTADKHSLLPLFRPKCLPCFLNVALTLTPLHIELITPFIFRFFPLIPTKLIVILF